MYERLWIRSIYKNKKTINYDKKFHNTESAVTHDLLCVIELLKIKMNQMAEKFNCKVECFFGKKK